MRNGSVDARLPAEAAALARCIRDAHGDGAAAHLQDGRLSPRVWHQCVAVACGLHACVVGQSLYALGRVSDKSASLAQHRTTHPAPPPSTFCYEVHK